MNVIKDFGGVNWGDGTPPATPPDSGPLPTVSGAASDGPGARAPGSAALAMPAPRGGGGAPPGAPPMARAHSLAASSASAAGGARGAAPSAGGSGSGGGGDAAAPPATPDASAAAGPLGAPATPGPRTGSAASGMEGVEESGCGSRGDEGEGGDGGGEAEDAPGRAPLDAAGRLQLSVATGGCTPAQQRASIEHLKHVGTDEIRAVGRVEARPGVGCSPGLQG
jgi:hypothetical protein